MKYPKCCKGCVHLHPLCGNRDKTGKRTISSYDCSKKNGFSLATKKGCAEKKMKQIYGARAE